MTLCGKGRKDRDSSRQGSPSFTSFEVPVKNSDLGQHDPVDCGCVGRGLIAFHSGRASIASIVSNVCACSPGPGMLCTLTPTLIVIGGNGSGAICADVPTA